MKKFTLSLFLCSILLLAITSCQKDEAEADDPDPIPEVENSLIIAQKSTRIIRRVTLEILSKRLF